jgi:DNA uptake protein ComE-like DNA-binding protein
MRKLDALKAIVFAALLAAASGSALAEEPPQDAGSPPPSAAEETPSPIAPPPATPPKPKLMDINTASREKLMSLPGMSERLADRVIAGRPYRSRVDLKSRNVLPVNVFNAIVELIVAKSPKLTATPTPRKK